MLFELFFILSTHLGRIPMQAMLSSSEGLFLFTNIFISLSLILAFRVRYYGGLIF